jgi:hypothetical protein
MSQNEAIDQSTSTPNSEITPKTYNLRKPISEEDLAIIIASHDKLLAWNNAAEIALKFDARSKNTDTTLIQNIRNTAALIISSERSTFSQNFELRRARNLSDSTLSTSEMVGSFVEGVLYEATSPARAIVNLQQPSSMKLSEANKRSDALENMVMHYGSQALDIVKQIPTSITNAASFTLGNPDVVAKNIINTANEPPDLVKKYITDTQKIFSQSLDRIPSVITHGLKGSNPEQAIGFNSGVIAFGIIKEAFGSTSHKVRDFSKHMTF